MTWLASSWPSSTARRSCSSRAALLLKVITTISHGLHPFSLIRYSTRDVRTRVLPLPGPAMILQSDANREAAYLWYVKHSLTAEDICMCNCNIAHTRPGACTGLLATLRHVRPWSGALVMHPRRCAIKSAVGCSLPVSVIILTMIST